MPTPQQAQAELRRRAAQAELDRRQKPERPPYGFAPGKELDLEGFGKRDETIGDPSLPKARLRDVPGIAGRGLVSAELGVAKGVLGTVDAALNVAPSNRALGFGAPFAPQLTEAQKIKMAKDTKEATAPLREAKRKIMSAQEKFTSQHSGALAWTTRTISEAVPYMANAFAAGAVVGPAGAFGVGFMVEGDYAYDDAIASGATEEQAQTERVVVGSLNAIIEALQVNKLLKFSKGGKHSLKNFVKLARTKGMKIAGKELKGWSGEVARLSIEEALEEFSQEGVSLGIPAVFRGEYPTKEDGSPDWLAMGERLGGAALGGAVAGPVLGGAGRVLTGDTSAPTTPIEKAMVQQMDEMAQTVPPVNVYKTVSDSRTGITEEIPPGSNVYKGSDGNTYIETPEQMGDKETQVTEERRDEEGNSRLFVKNTDIEVTQDFEHSVSGRQDAPMSETPAAPEQVTRPPRQSKSMLRAIGHKIARESNVSNEDYRDYAEVVTGKRSMKDMTRKQMEEFVVALEESFGSPTELSQEDFETPITVAGRGTTMGSVYRDSVDAVNKLAPKRKIPARVKLGHGKPGKLHALKNFFFGIDNTPVYHLARILDGATDGIFSEVFDKGIQLGTKITDSHKRSTFGVLRAGLEEAGVTDADLAKMGKAVNPRTQTHQMIRESAATEIMVGEINGREFEMTWANLIDIYLIANQEAGLKHLQEGGLVINGVETGKLSDAWILDTMMKVEENEKAKTVADAILKVGSDIWAPSLNQVSNRLEGKDIATVEDWWGLEVYMPKRIKGKQRTGISLTIPKGINLIEDKGILKDRTRSGAPLVVRDAFSRFAVFEDAVAEYVGMAEPTRTTRTLLNDPVIAKTLKQKGYDDVLKNIRRIHETAQSVRPSEGGLTAFVERHLPALYRAALHANPPVIVSQATSTFNYGAYASPEFMASVKDGLSIKLCQETLALSDVAWARHHMGQSSLELGEMARSDAALRMFTNKAADINKLGWGLKIGDLVALTGGMSIAQAEYKKALKGELKGLSAEWWIEKNNLPEVDVDMWRRVTEEGENADPQERQAVEVWKQTVSERAEYLWQRTQPSWDKWNRSVITSQKGIARTFLLFRSFQEKCLTIFNEAKLTYDNSPKSLADKTAFVQKTGSVMASYTVNMALRLAILAAMTRKTKEPIDYLQDVLTSWMGMFPVFGKVLDASARTFIAALADTKPTYRGEALESYPVSIFNMALKTPVDFTAAVGHFVSGDNDKAETSFLKGIDNIFKGVGAIYGVPVYQIKRIMPKAGEERTSAPTRRRVAPPVRRRS